MGSRSKFCSFPGVTWLFNPPENFSGENKDFPKSGLTMEGQLLVTGWGEQDPVVRQGF